MAARQVGGIVRPALTLRVIALAVVLTVLIQLADPLAIALCLPAVVICAVRARSAPGSPATAGARRTAPTTHSVSVVGSRPGDRASGRADGRSGGRSGGRSVGRTYRGERGRTYGGEGGRTDGGEGGRTYDRTVGSATGEDSSPTRRRRWIITAWWDLLSALLVVTVSAWATVGLTASSRFLALGAGAMLVAVVSVRLCLDPRWYRPDRQPRRVSRWLRTLAGPLGMLACQLLALTAPWGPGERTVVVLLTLLPLANVAMTVDQDHTLRFLVEMVRTEAQDGRQSVLDELHGTLSANLRLLEQACSELRASSPRLYELAVGANSSLRETLTLADPQLDSAAQPETLVALVRTLTMAVGAHGELSVRVQQLAEPDRDLVRLVLNDLLRALLAGGATKLQATIEATDGELRVVVTADRVIDDDVVDMLEPLRQRLSTVSETSVDRHSAGVVRFSARRRLMARWPAAPGTG